jgi:RNA polymerase sigma-70 factor (ECF subfamily)
MDELLHQDSMSPTMKLRKPDSTDDRSESGTDARTFEELFVAYWDSIYRILIRMIGDPAEAEDLALETFFRLYNNPPKTSRDTNLGGWLYRVATNLGLHSIRSYRRRESHELAAGRDALETSPQNRPAQIFEDKEQLLNARSAFSRMNPRRAKILVLRYSGVAYKEIAGILGLSPSSIGPLLQRAEREFETIYRDLAQEET